MAWSNQATESTILQPGDTVKVVSTVPSSGVNDNFIGASDKRVNERPLSTQASDIVIPRQCPIMHLSSGECRRRHTAAINLYQTGRGPGVKYAVPFSLLGALDLKPRPDAKAVGHITGATMDGASRHRGTRTIRSADQENFVPVKRGLAHRQAPFRTNRVRVVSHRENGEVSRYSPKSSSAIAILSRHATPSRENPKRRDVISTQVVEGTQE